MFKRYTKNPFEKEQNSTTFEESSSNASQKNNINAYSSKRQHSLFQEQMQKEYKQGIPPRIFEDRPMQKTNPHSTSHEEGIAQEDLWNNESSTVASSKDPLQNELPPEEPETTLGEGVFFKGQLNFKTLLRIDGKFEGELISDGKLIIGPSGVVKSNVKLREAIIEGYLEGNMEVKERVELRGEAQVRGDIRTKFLSVDEGVTIVGCVEVSPKDEAESNTENEHSNNKKP